MADLEQRRESSDETDHGSTVGPTERFEGRSLHILGHFALVDVVVYAVIVRSLSNNMVTT